MTATIPAPLAWPLIALMAAVIALRYRWFNKSLYDTYFNNTLTLMLIAQLLRERSFENLLSANALIGMTTAQQLSLAAVFFMAAEFMGFITMWSRLSPEQTKRRQSYHRASAVLLSALFLAAATRARVNGQVLEVSGGWDGVLAWCLYAVLPVALAIQILHMCLTESRRPEAKRRERLVAISAMPIAAAIGITTLIAVLLELLQQLGLADTVDYRLHTHAQIFFWEAIGTTAVASIPCVLAVRAHFGLDPISSRWRQLQQLRCDMNAAVPGSAFEIRHQNPGRRKTALQLHQTTVQIRDAVLQLRSYFRDPDPHVLSEFFELHSVPSAQRREATLAYQLAEAVRTKEAGGFTAEVDAGLFAKSRSTNLDEEAAELLTIAAWWLRARAAVELTAAADADALIHGKD